MMPPNTAPGSLRVRLLAGTLVWIIATIVIAGWGLSSLFRDHVERQFYAELKIHLDQLTANLAIDGAGQPSLSAPLTDPRLSKPYAGLYWQIDRLAGADTPAVVGLLRSRSLWDSALDAPRVPDSSHVARDAPLSSEIHPHPIAGPRGAALGLMARRVIIEGPFGRPAQTFVLMAAADRQLTAAPIARFNGTLWLALGVLALGLASAAIFQVVVGLSPLRRLRTALSAVRNGDTQQLQGGFPSEIQPLVAEFNAVLTQNTEVVTRARTQAGNLAHALKTPLSVLANAAAEKDSALARLVNEQIDTARRQVDYHLKRASAAATVRMPGVHTPLAPVVKGLTRVMRRVHAERNLDLRVQPIAGSLTFRGEEQDLHEMLGNLLDNACKWAKQRIDLHAMPGPRDQNTLLVTLDDDGAGIASPHRGAMLRRGTRDDENIPGSGLGLAIVEDLTRLYGGQIELTESPLGGLRVVLTLPAAVLPHKN